MLGRRLKKIAKIEARLVEGSPRTSLRTESGLVTLIAEDNDMTAEWTLSPDDARRLASSLERAAARADTQRGLRCFSFRRSRDGAVVWLHDGPLSVNLCAYKSAPRGMNFATARAWARGYAAEQGFEYRERKGDI